MKKPFIFIISLYQHTLGILKGPTCVFIPTCSEYTKQAIKKYGVIRGIFLGMKRISRCHPWQKSKGYNPVL